MIEAHISRTYFTSLSQQSQERHYQVTYIQSVISFEFAIEIPRIDVH